MRRRATILLMAAAICTCCAGARAEECSKWIEEGKHHFGQFHEGAERFDQAIAAYRKASERSACAYEAYWRMSDLYLCRGTVTAAKKEKLAYFQKGVETAERAIRINPDGKEGHYQYGVNQGSIVQVDGIMKNLTKVHKVKKANDKALALDGNFPPALLVNARFMADLPGIFGGSDEKAEATFRQAIAADPAYDTPYVEFAAFLIKRKRYDEAEELLTTLLRPDFPHRFQGPWMTIDKPKAEELLEKIRLAGEKK